jgi:hypothetical protein
VRIKCRIDSQNSEHTRFTVFQDGGNCGQLTMNTAAAALFFDILKRAVMDDMGYDFELQNKEA